MAYFGRSYWSGNGYWNSLYWGAPTAAVDPYPCNEVLPEGGKGTGVCSEGTDFPFVQPSPDVQGILADLCLVHEVRTAVPPLSLVYLAGMDKGFCQNNGTHPGHHDADIRIKDVRGQVVFDSATANYYRAAAWSERLRVHEWRTAKATCRLVQHTAFPDAGSVRTIPAQISPVDGRLDERCSQTWPLRLDSVAVAGGMGLLAGTPGLVVAGYNIDLQQSQLVRGFRQVTQLTIAAVPGAGAGLYPGCTEPVVVNLEQVNGVGPNGNGDFSLAAAGCYWLRVPSTRSGGLVTPASATLQLGNDCGPCCTCDDYEAVQRGILVQWNEYEEIALTSRLTLAQYQYNIDRWNRAAACYNSQQVHVNALPAGDNVDAIVAICNSSTDCLTGTAIIITVNTATGVPFEVIPSATFITNGLGRTFPYTLAQSGNTLTATWETVPPQVSVSVRFRLLFGPRDAATDVTVAATATTDNGVTGLPGAAAMTVTLGASDAG
jgi:hypothetical protein